MPGQGELVTGFQSAPSAPDGETFRERQFVVWLPPNYSDDKVYPVLVIVTGTVESTYQSMFSTSAGLGQAFLNKGWRDLIGAVRRSSTSPRPCRATARRIPAGPGGRGTRARPASARAGTRRWDRMAPI